MEYSTLAFIGRFQPFHNGHKAVVDSALLKVNKVAIVIGSHDKAPDTRNPLTTRERIDLIAAVYPNEVANGRIKFVPQVDHTYNLDRWIAGVISGVESVAYSGKFEDDPVIGLIGHSKDESSFYLKCFPRWKSVEVPNVSIINATDIRERLYNDISVKDYMPKAAHKALMQGDSRLFGDMAAEFRFNMAYQKQFRMPSDEELYEWCWDRGIAHVESCDIMPMLKDFMKDWKSPYLPTHKTVDAVVVQSGHLLLVKRGSAPGKGLWALPGGFLNQGETLLSGALRELKEETKIDVPMKVLRGSYTKQQEFDDPHRSLRGRTLTTAFLFNLTSQERLPKIKGSDDAVKAKWVPLGEVMTKRNKLFEDHYDIIETMTAI
ncbi:MAG: ADP-ribose pyrophosphatase [Robiginitomaculum sp.]|nr:MAG: ADP-ribose pyrophosphatase [Robiginitomaculum sp.]